METRFAASQLTRVERRNPYNISNRMPMHKLQELTPAFDWKTYTSALDVPSGGTLNVSEPKFMRELQRQLTETPLEDWKLYLQWHLARDAAEALSKPFVEEEFAFNGAFLNGAKEMKPRWKQCVEMTDAALGEALGKVYVEKVFPPAAKTRMQELVKNLTLALESNIKRLEWMTGPTKQKALAKLATFDPKLGYPDKWKDYSGVRMVRNGYWDNVSAANRFVVRDRLNEIGKPVDRTKWFMTTPTSNAYYNPLRNEIVFPAGILLPPMFSLDADDAINYGAIGSVIGHEITHGYDDQGSQFDAKGRLKNWWTPEDREQFMKRAHCVVEQFDAYEIEPGVRHNGKLVLGESIGDFAGVKIAYAAYMK